MGNYTNLAGLFIFDFEFVFTMMNFMILRRKNRLKDPASIYLFKVNDIYFLGSHSNFSGIETFQASVDFSINRLN